MNVAINTLIITQSSGGGKTFLTNLVAHIAEIDKHNIYYLIVSGLNESLFGNVGENFKKVTVPLRSNNRPLRGFYQQILVPYYVAKHKVDVLLSYGNIATLFPGCKQAVIVDGAQTLRGTRRRYAPGTVSRIRTIYFDVMLPLSLKRASCVITVSEFMKKELVNGGGIPAQKVTVIHEGIDDKHFSTEHNEAEAPGLPRPYILFLSDLHKHKNADKLIYAFAILKRRSDIPHKLVIVGRDYGNTGKMLRQQAHRLGVTENTIFTGPVPHEAVAGVYRNADVFVLPSAFESFGLPVLEAMASGTPVIASNGTAIPEILGDAGLTVDPADVEGLADSLHSVITDRRLRDSLVRKGYERARSFTWERAARDTVKVLEDLA